jgi:hypothetical protein
MTDRKKPGVAFWATVVVVVVLVGYPLSFGPVAWLSHHKRPPGWIGHLTEYFYTPLFWIVQHAPMPILDLFKWYIDLWR